MFFVWLSHYFCCRLTGTLRSSLLLTFHTKTHPRDYFVYLLYTFKLSIHPVTRARWLLSSCVVCWSLSVTYMRSLPYFALQSLVPFRCVCNDVAMDCPPPTVAITKARQEAHKRLLEDVEKRITIEQRIKDARFYDWNAPSVRKQRASHRARFEDLIQQEIGTPNLT